MTLTFEYDLQRVKLSHHAKCLDERSFRSKVIFRAHRDTHTADRSLYLATKLTSNDSEYGTSNSIY